MKFLFIDRRLGLSYALCLLLLFPGYGAETTKQSFLGNSVTVKADHTVAIPGLDGILIVELPGGEPVTETPTVTPIPLPAWTHSKTFPEPMPTVSEMAIQVAFETIKKKPNGEPEEEDSVTVRLLGVELDKPAFTLTTDPDKGILTIGNDYTSTPTTPEVERSAHVRFIPKDFIESNSASISMGISSPDDDGGQVNIGSIDSSAFDSSGGIDPFKYLARTETLQNKDHDDPVLETQYIYFNLSFSGNTIFDAQETQAASILEVTNRFDFLYVGARIALDYSEEVAAGKAIDFVITKYGLGISEIPEYDPDLYDPAGSTDTIAGVVTGVRVGPLGFDSERTLAGLMIHEETHVNQTVFERSSAVTGKRTYGLWVASGRLLPLTSYDVSLIYLYVGVEQEAILNEQGSVVYLQHMSEGERANADNYWDEMEAIKTDLGAHGYTL